MQTDAHELPAQASFDRAQTLLKSRRVTSALEAFDEAERLGHPATDCAAGRWSCWMLLGDFERAWRESDHIAATGQSDPHKFWDGSPWAGRHVMLRCLHGLGDTINFIRYAPLLRQTCRELTVQAHPELVRLLKAVPAIDRVLTWQASEPAWDLQMEVNELPRIFRTVEATIPAGFPYFSLPAPALARMAPYVPATGRCRVGLVWRAGPFDPSRSLTLADLAPLLELANADFYSLQQAPEPDLAERFPQLPDLHARAGIEDVLDTAALLSHLDLLITVDTMTAHLAGALGKPVWIVLPEVADWRWMLDRSTSPWYPTARLYRQPDALAEVQRDLLRKLAA